MNEPTSDHPIFDHPVIKPGMWILITQRGDEIFVGRWPPDARQLSRDTICRVVDIRSISNAAATHRLVAIELERLQGNKLMPTVVCYPSIDELPGGNLTPVMIPYAMDPEQEALILLANL